MGIQLALLVYLPVHVYGQTWYGQQGAIKVYQLRVWLEDILRAQDNFSSQSQRPVQPGAKYKATVFFYIEQTMFFFIDTCMRFYAEAWEVCVGRCQAQGAWLFAKGKGQQGGAVDADKVPAAWDKLPLCGHIKLHKACI